MKMKPIKVEFYLLKSQLEPEYRIRPESVYVKIHLPPYFDDGKAKYRPYRFPVCRIIPKYFGEPDSRFKYDGKIVEDNRKYNVHFIEARDKIYDAMIAIEKKYGYQLPSNDVLKLEIDIFIGRNIEPNEVEAEVEIVNEEPEVICILSVVNLYFEKMVATSKQNKTNSRSRHTIDSYRTMILNLQRYVKENETVDLLKLTNQQWEILWEVILTYKKGGGNYKYSTIQLQQTQLRSILKKLPSNNVPLMNLNDDLIDTTIDPVNQHTQLFLSEDELKTLIKTSFENPDMEYGRKYLIIASLTGQRYQSMRQMSGCPIEWNKEYGFHFAHFVHMKTGTHCYCPLFYDVVQLCPGGVFMTVDKVNQNGQYWIDKVVVELGIKNAVNITSHSCKKTFVSLLKPYRVRNEVIALVTHPSEKFSETCVGDYDKSDLMYKSEEFYDATVGIVVKYPDTVFRY
jgi:hypothetical protein